MEIIIIIGILTVVLIFLIGFLLRGVFISKNSKDSIVESLNERENNKELQKERTIENQNELLIKINDEKIRLLEEIANLKYNKNLIKDEIKAHGPHFDGFHSIRKGQRIPKINRKRLEDGYEIEDIYKHIKNKRGDQ